MTAAPISVLAVLALAMPLVLAGRVPPIPAGHRAQYSLQHADGSFKYGWDTGRAPGRSWARAEGDASNEVRGTYSTGPLRVQYTAGVQGFVPIIEANDEPSHLVGPAPASSGWSSSWASGQQAVPAPQPTWSAWKPSQQGIKTMYSFSYDTGSQPGLPAPALEPVPEPEPEPDASYSFGFETADSARHEESDAIGNVQGSYSYTDPAGTQRHVQYEAGAGKGFVVKEDVIAVGTQSAGAGSWAVASGAQSANFHGSVQRPFDDGDVQEHLDAVGVQGGDGSYAFSYATEDQHRQEEGDAKGNVKGSFSFKAPDHINRTVEYEAGAGKGFIAKGDHLPKTNLDDDAVLPAGSGKGLPGHPEGLRPAVSPAARPHPEFHQVPVRPTGFPTVLVSTEPSTVSSTFVAPSSDDDPGMNVQEEATIDIRVDPKIDVRLDSKIDLRTFGGGDDGDETQQTEVPDVQQVLDEQRTELPDEQQTQGPDVQVTEQDAGYSYLQASGERQRKPGQFLVAAAAAGVTDVHGGARGLGRGHSQAAGLEPCVAGAVDPAGPLGAGVHAQQLDIDGASVRTYVPPGRPCHKVGYVYEDRAQ